MKDSFNNEEKLISFQLKIRDSIKNLNNLNNKLEKCYFLICSIMNNIERKYHLKIINQNEYNKIIEELIKKLEEDLLDKETPQSDIDQTDEDTYTTQDG